MKRVILTALVAAIIAIAGSDGAWAQGKELRFGLYFAGTTTTGEAVLKPWFKWFGEQAKGAAHIKLYDGGALGRDPTKQYKLVKDGVADVVFMIPGYQPGQFPEMPMFELPNLARDAAEGSHVIWSMYKKGYLKGFEGVKVVALYSSDPAVVHGMVPIRKIEDLQGLKVRVAGEFQKLVVDALGGVPVGMPVTQIAESLTRGVVQATLIGWTGGTSFRVPQTAPYHLQVPLGVNPFLIIMNQQVYEGLPAHARKAVDESGELIVSLQSGDWADEDKKLIKQFQNDPKMTVTIPSKEDFARMDKLFKPVHDAWIKDHGRVAYDAYVAELKEYRAKHPDN